MNIIKIQDQLKGVPDDALIGYVQNPTGQVPTYLALSELQRRKTMRDTYQQAQPAQTTVAEDLAAPPPPMQQAAPTMPADQGVAALPTGDMFQEQNFAGGGIVAFDNGGDVSNYRQDQTALNLNLAGNPSENSKDGNPVNAVTNLLGMARMGGLSPNMGMPGGVNGMGTGNPMGLLGLLGLGKQALQPRSYALNLNSGKQEAQYAGGGEVQYFEEGGTSRLGDYFRNLRTTNLEKQKENKLINDLLSEKYRIEGDVFSKLTPEQKAAQDNALKQIDVMLSEAKAKKASGVSNAPTTIPGAGVMGSQSAANAMTGMQYDPSQALNIKGPNVASTKLPLAADGTDPYALEKVRGIGDYAKELQDYIGVDPMRAKLQERMDKMDATSAKQAEQAPWMALAQAGFGMAAGKSPFALQNIAEGAGMGLKEYAAARDKMAALEDKRFSLLNDIAQADRKEKIAIGTYGANSKQATEERNAKAKLQQAHDKVLMKMNADDNARAFQVAQQKNQPTITESLKVQEFIAQNLPQEKKRILQVLGGNADKPDSRNYDEYKKQVDEATIKLANQARTIPGMNAFSGDSVSGKQIKFLGFE
jgi:hypothetical protein